MIFTQNWKDYELLDCADGMRLERWGTYILQRPDPQVIWHGCRRTKLWDKADAVYHRSASGGGAWEKHHLPEQWQIGYGELRFVIRPTGFKHTGLFPEQAANWDWFSGLIHNAGREVKVLNLFAYTGGATVAAAKAGASVTHVDASRGMVAQAKENAALCGLADAPIRYFVDDCKKLLEREIRRGNRYDGIIMDPPSYGRGPNGEVWKLEDGIYELTACASKLLSDNALFFLLNSYTTGLSAGTTGYLLHTLLGDRAGGKIVADEVGIPVSSTGAILPCGSAARWSREAD